MCGASSLGVIKHIYSTVLRQVHPDQDLQLGQRAGHPGGEQVRHGGREGHLLRTGQAARRQSRTPIL